MGRGSILIAGTGSDAGKSVIVAGLCRVLSRRGVKVAPFKAQNMSLNSAVTDDGAEIGRAQAAQAMAAGVAPEAAMNPVLLKPTDDRRAQVIVMGHPLTDADARSYIELKQMLLQTVIGAYEDLRSRFDVIVCEGAGSPAEINLRRNDIANMGFARATGTPVVLVGDIDRGGVFASLYGSLALLDEDDQALISGFIINKFRGDVSILAPGLEQLLDLTGRPTFGVLPWQRDLWIDAEDALSFEVLRRRQSAPIGQHALRVAIVALAHMSNFTDFDPLICEPGVVVNFTRSHADLLEADLAIIPGTKATVADLEQLRADGLDGTLVHRAELGKVVLGICGGYQMLGDDIVDGVEGSTDHAEGLGLLPVRTTFGPDKILRLRGGRAIFGAAQVNGYEIRHGSVERHGGEAMIQTSDGAEGCIDGAVVGTSWHGIFESDTFRREFLHEVAARTGRDWVPGEFRFSEVRESQVDRLADSIETHLDIDRLTDVMVSGVQQLPIVSGGLRQRRGRSDGWL